MSQEQHRVMYGTCVLPQFVRDQMEMIVNIVSSDTERQQQHVLRQDRRLYEIEMLVPNATSTSTCQLIARMNNKRQLACGNAVSGSAE